MPKGQPQTGSPEDWLRHARSDLALARGPAAPDVLLEALCFHAQQAAEKSIKAVLLAEGIPFPYTHDLARLITLVQDTDIPWPEHLVEAADLTGYAAELRYPGSLEPVTSAEHQQAVSTAAAVLVWAEKFLSEGEEQGVDQG